MKIKKTIISFMLVIIFLLIVEGTSHAWWTKDSEILMIHQRANDITIRFMRSGSTQSEIYAIGEENNTTILFLALTAFSGGNKVRFEIVNGFIIQIKILTEGYSESL